VPGRDGTKGSFAGPQPLLTMALYCIKNFLFFWFIQQACQPAASRAQPKTDKWNAPVDIFIVLILMILLATQA
jgi:hypothetical protein